jgi:hypothetical protein
MSENRPLRARAVLDSDDYVRAFRLHGGYRVRALRVLVVLIGGGLLFGAIRALSSEQGEVAVVFGFLGIVGVTCGLLAGFQQRSNIVKQLRQMEKESEEVHYEIGDDHLHIETKEGTGNIPWSKFRKWREKQGLIIAYRHDQNFVIIPVGQLEPAAANLLRDRLHAHSRRA